LTLCARVLAHALLARRNKKVAREGGNIAGHARKQIEGKTGKKVISKISFKKIKEQKKLG